MFPEFTVQIDKGNLSLFTYINNEKHKYIRKKTPQNVRRSSLNNILFPMKWISTPGKISYMIREILLFLTRSESKSGSGTFKEKP